MKDNYVIATVKSWNIDYFKDAITKMDGNWKLVTSPEDLSTEFLTEFKPRYIFFPHWNWIVPEEITSQYECVCFHMTDVPFGRGGSPLQNLIVRGYTETKLTALRMVRELDAGPVYEKVDLSLEGNAQEIFKRTTPKIHELIDYISLHQPTPTPQFGDVEVFERRKPAQSKLPADVTLKQIYDFIRMLDGEGYPRAFIEYGEFTLEFDQATYCEDNELIAQVKIQKRVN